MSANESVAARPMSASEVRESKGRDRKIVMLTAYDLATAQYAEAGGVDMALVGDSLGIVVYGFASTRDVSMELMLPHVGAVRRGAPNTHVVADMPYRSFDTPDTAVANARRFLDAGADSVKIEGASDGVAEALRDENVPVMGHVGLLPQTATSFKARGRAQEEADAICRDAHQLAAAGCFCVVLEHMPMSLGQRITAELPVPTIGIGAGPSCDGQVLVVHDMLGLLGVQARFQPPFVKRYAEVGSVAIDAILRYAAEVRGGLYPDEAHSTK